MNLTELQTKLKAPKNQYNAFGKYNYRSCEDILEALKPLLTDECELRITDQVKDVCGIPYVESAVVLQIGDKVYTSVAQAGINPDKKGMDIAQSFGASSSYARKYALNALFLIDDTKDSDSLDNSNQNTGSTAHENRVKELTDKIYDSNSLEELKQAWSSVPQGLQKTLETAKNERKAQLS